MQCIRVFEDMANLYILLEYCPNRVRSLWSLTVLLSAPTVLGRADPHRLPLWFVDAARCAEKAATNQRK